MTNTWHPDPSAEAAGEILDDFERQDQQQPHPTQHVDLPEPTTQELLDQIPPLS